MKKLLPLTLLPTLFLMSAAEEPPANPNNNAANPVGIVEEFGGDTSNTVLVDMQVLTLPQATALPLIRKMRAAAAAEQTAAYDELQQLLEKGTARLLAWPTLSTGSGQRAASEATEEMHYPSEFAVGTASVYMSDADGTLTKQPKAIRATDTPPVASSFESRQLGFSLQAEPQVGPDGKTVQLTIRASHTQLKSIDKWTIEHETQEKKTEKIIQEQPRFTVFSAENLVNFQSGEHKMVGIFKTTDAEPTIELFVMGVEVVVAGKQR